MTLHNVRNCDCRTENGYTSQWETRTARLSQLTGMDVATIHWGSLCFSIETRMELGESYSALAGFYRHYELIYVAADQRDVLHVSDRIKCVRLPEEYPSITAANQSAGGTGQQR